MAEFEARKKRYLPKDLKVGDEVLFEDFMYVPEKAKDPLDCYNCFLKDPDKDTIRKVVRITPTGKIAISGFVKQKKNRRDLEYVLFNKKTGTRCDKGYFERISEPTKEDYERIPADKIILDDSNLNWLLKDKKKKKWGYKGVR